VIFDFVFEDLLKAPDDDRHGLKHSA